MQNSFGSKLQSAFASYGQLCVGIDPHSKILADFGESDSVSGVEKFSLSIVEAAAGRVGIVKPQVAFFERFGAKGFLVLEKVCTAAKRAGLLVIADAKRGDIGSTMEGYSSAWLSHDSPFQVDALTLSPYLGPDTLSKSYEAAVKSGKGIFVLAATSNPEGKPVQLADTGSQSVAALVAQRMQLLSASESGSIRSAGLVVGATVDLESYGFSQNILDEIPILAPGFGVQGSKLSDLKNIFGSLSKYVIANVGRSIYGEDQKAIIRNIEDSKNELDLASSK